MTWLVAETSRKSRLTIRTQLTCLKHPKTMLFNGFDENEGGPLGERTADCGGKFGVRDSPKCARIDCHWTFSCRPAQEMIASDLC